MKNYSSVLIIYNPLAKRGKIDSIIPYIKKRLLVRFSVVDAIPTPQVGAEDIALKNAGKYDIIVSCGGDGTLHQVINGIAKSNFNPLIGVLPFGTCNDVARTLGINKKLDNAIDAILRLNTTNYDLMFDGEEYYVYALATGYFTDTSYMASSRSKRIFGKLAYVWVALKDLFRLKGLPMSITCDEERFHSKYFYFMLMNGISTGGFTINKGEDLSNNKVKLVMIEKKNALSSLIKFVKLFLFGIKSVKNSKHVIVRDAQNILIENHSNEPFTMDGEKTTFLRKNVTVVSKIKLIKK